MRQNRSLLNKPSGMTILEVIVAFIILGFSLAALGELSRLAFLNARDSKDLVQAELLAESILAKVRLGIIDMESAYDVPVSNMSARNDEISDTNVGADGGAAGGTLWIYTLEVNDIDDYGLVELAVTVRQNPDQFSRPASCRLVRWFAQEPEEEEEDESTETTTTE